MFLILKNKLIISHIENMLSEQIHKQSENCSWEFSTNFAQKVLGTAVNFSNNFILHFKILMRFN